MRSAHKKDAKQQGSKNHKTKVTKWKKMDKMPKKKMERRSINQGTGKNKQYA